MSEYEVKPQEMQSLADNGFFIRESVFQQSDLEKMRNAVEDIHSRMVEHANGDSAPPVQMVDDKRYQDIDGSCVKWEWQEDSRDIRSMEPFLFLHPDLDSLIDDPRIVVPTRHIMGTEEISLFTDKLNFKRPGGAPFPWHQDSPYFVFGCSHVDHLLSLQIYLDDAKVDNGCLWMIPGSHRQGILPGVQNKGVLDRLYTDMDQVPEGDFVPITVPAGSVIFFNTHVVHGSKTNTTADNRRAMVITYQPNIHDMWKAPGHRRVKIPQG